MTQPAEGTTPAAGGYTTTDPRFQGGHRTGIIGVAFRQARGAETNISPHNPDGSIRYSPITQDNKLRADLFAVLRDGNSVWVPNPEPNEGWYLVGAHGEGNGASTKPRINVEKQRIEQSNRPFEQEKTEQEEPFTFEILQNLMPWNIRLREDLPLVDANGNSLVEMPGGANAGWSQQVEPGDLEWQFLIFAIRKKHGKYLLEIDAYDCAKQTDISEYKRGKKGTASQLTYEPVQSGYFMAVVDGEYKPIIKHTFVGGDAWTALGVGGASIFDVTLGTQTTGNFTLGFRGKTTANIAYNATAANVKAALVALDDGFDADDWTVTGSAGGPYEITTPGGTLSGTGTGLGTPGTFEVAPA